MPTGEKGNLVKKYAECMEKGSLKLSLLFRVNPQMKKVRTDSIAKTQRSLKTVFFKPTTKINTGVALS